MSQESRSARVRDLFRAAQREGKLSDQSMQVLDVIDLGEQVAAGLGISVDDVEASEVILVTLMPDDSGSIAAAGNAEAVRDGHNLVLAALAGSAQQGEVLCHTRYLNGRVLSPFCPIDKAPRLDARNYDPGLGTPLHDQTIAVLATVIAKTQELEDAGVPCRSVTLLISDGADNQSRAGARQVRAVVEDMLRAENHIIAALGISDGGTDFVQVFTDMGIPPRWILTPASTSTDIRAAFRLFSQSALRATN
jgi:hypothetical protein